MREYIEERWTKLPTWGKYACKCGLVIVIGLNIWVVYRENQKRRRKKKFNSNFDDLKPRNELLDKEFKIPRVPQLPVRPSLPPFPGPDGESTNYTPTSHTASSTPMTSSYTPGAPNPSMTSSLCDSDEDVTLLIKRGIQDLQTGIKLSMETASKRKRLACSFASSGSSSSQNDTDFVITERSPYFSPDRSIQGTPIDSDASLRNTPTRRRHMSTSPGEQGQFMSELSNLLQSADRLDRMMHSGNPLRVRQESISDLESIASDRTLRNSGSISSLDSYMTCYDEFDYSLFPFLHRGIQQAERGLIECRKLQRYQIFNQRSEREYLGKLFCLRKADQSWGSDPAARNWLREMTSAVVRGLLIVDNTDPEPFQEAFDTLLDWSWRHPEKLREELKEQQIPELSFFDVVIDWCLLDAIDDQANPPASITSVLQNRWLGNDYKRTGMTTAVWSYIKTKRFRLTTKDSFMTRYYDLCNTIVPSLAWGFLGPSSPYSELCRSFKAEIVALCQDIFANRDSWKSQKLLEADLRELISKTFKRLFSALSEATGEHYDFVEAPPIQNKRTYSESANNVEES